MRTALYVIWILIPLLFFAMALWAKLEEIGNRGKKQNVSDLMKQGGFVALCVAAAIAIEQYLLGDLVEALSPEFIPLAFYQILLLPLILLIAAKIIGPTKDIRITRAKGQKRKRGGR